MPERQNRTSILNVRLEPSLRAKIDEDARERDQTASALVRDVLVRHYEER